MQNSFYTDPVYDHIVWSQMCTIEVAGKGYWFEGGQDISIVSRDGKYGLILIEHINNEDSLREHFIEHGLCNCCYDTIYNLKCEGWCGRIASGCFVVFSGGKCGLLELRCSEDKVMFECIECVACLYDSIEPQCNEDILILYRGEKACYYNLKTKFLSPEYNSICVRGDFLVCETKSETFIVDSHNDKNFMEEVR